MNGPHKKLLQGYLEQMTLALQDAQGDLQSSAASHLQVCSNIASHLPCSSLPSRATGSSIKQHCGVEMVITDDFVSYASFRQPASAHGISAEEPVAS